METSKAILLLSAIVLLGATLLLFVLYSDAQAQANEAASLGLVVRDLLRAGHVACSAGATQYARLAACVQPMLAAKDFKEDAFKQPDPRTGAPGYLVIRNTGVVAYDATRFSFSVNREKRQTGCKDLTGSVDKEVTCRFDFAHACEKGAIIEATYPMPGDDGQERDVRVFLKTC